MNLAQSLDASLVELPQRRVRGAPRRLHPRIISREHQTLEGTPEIVAMVQGGESYIRFSREQWQMVQLFDGRRTSEEIAEAFHQQTEVECDAEEVEQLAEVLDDAGFWYKSPQETALELQRRAEQRQQFIKKKSKVADLGEVMLLYWDPDRYLTWLDRKIGRVVYSRWFTLLALALFAFTVYVFVDRWSEISRDTLEYFNFSQKGFVDIVEFWLLILFIGFFHETAHGLTCKHCGAGSHKMGAVLIYLTPAFFCEVVEAWIYGTRAQRIATIVAGLWVEFIICGLATIVWWGTPAGTFAHDFTYKFLLLCGVAGVVNANPLFKTDGYLVFTEIIDTPDLKERSTEFATSWARHHIFGLPVEVPHYAPRRRWFYMIYAVLAGIYSYTLLLVVVRLLYNILHHYTPTWAFIPALGLAGLIFKSRLRAFGKLMKSVYLDRKERWKSAWLRPRPLLAGLAILLFLAAPWRRETVEARFVLEPAQRSIVRAEVPGQVREVLVREGETVAAGAPLARLTNLQLESEAADAKAQLYRATARTTRAELQYAGYGPALLDQRRLADRLHSLSEQQGKLTLISPLAGVVVTPRMHDLQGEYLRAGALVAEVEDPSTLRARIFVPEAYVRKVHSGSGATLEVAGRWGRLRGHISSVSDHPQTLAPGLEAQTAYQGAQPLSFYTAFMILNNGRGELRDGESGTAKIFGRYRSLLGSAWEVTSDFWGRKLW